MKAVLCTLLCLAFLAGGPATADSWESKDWHCSIDLPYPWKVATDAELAQVIARIRQQLGSKVDQYHYVAGFYPEGGSLGRYPYALVQTISTKGHAASYDDIEQDLALESKSIKEYDGAPKDLLKSVALDSAVLDRTYNRIVMRFRIHVNGVGMVDGLSTGHLTKDGVVMVHCYDQVDTFEQSLSTFEDVNEGVKIDPAYAFVPAPSRWENVGPIAILAIVVIMVALLIFVLIKRRQAA